MIVGSGPHGEEQDLAAGLARAGLGDRVVLAGWQEPAALPAHVAAADVALYPLDDTLLNRAKCPAKLVELMAAGRPIVAESVGEADTYINHQETGLLVKPGNTDAFAAAVTELLHDPARAQQLGAAAQGHAWTRYHWDVLAQEAENAYAAAVR